MTAAPSGANLLTAKSSRPRKRGGGQRTSGRFARGAGIFVLVLLFGATGMGGYALSADPSLIAHGVTIGGLAVGGMTSTQASNALDARLAAMRMDFTAGNETVTVPIGGRADREPIASYDIGSAVEKALGIGNQERVVAAAAARMKAGVIGADIPLTFQLDTERLVRELEDRLSSRTSGARNARLLVSFNGGRPTVAVGKESDGSSFDFTEAVAHARERLARFSTVPIPLRKIVEKPTIVASDIEPLRSPAAEAVARSPITLEAKGEKWVVSAQRTAAWIAALPGPDGGASLGLDVETARQFLAEIDAAIAVPPSDAVFSMTDGRVKEFVPAIVGEGVDADAAIALIEDALFRGAEPGENGAYALPLKEVPPAIDTGASNPYGIKEIVGVGESNFRGSPQNRRWNIAVGAKAIDGILVMPGEEFSLLKALGEISEERGYKRELVIKENKTTPELGGGLCQIGSTTFRAVLDSGLPVTERRNHSYRVPYYERAGDGSYIGPGKDATIYDPAPDFKFLNDTGHALLFKTAIKGDRLTFTVWGVKDGRTAAQTAATVSNIKEPPPKKIIETTELPVGETKCTEKPHVGSDAVFTYTVTYPDGNVVKKDFFSRYRPWQEVCLVGVDPALVGETPGATSAPSADAEGATGR